MLCYVWLDHIDKGMPVMETGQSVILWEFFPELSGKTLFFMMDKLKDMAWLGPSYKKGLWDTGRDRVQWCSLRARIQPHPWMLL